MNNINMKPETFIFLVATIILIQLLIFFRKELTFRILNINLLNLYVILYIFFILMFQFALFIDKKEYLELPHLWMNIGVIVTSLFVNDRRILITNVTVLILTVLSRLYYNGCAINIAGNKRKTFIPEFLNKLQEIIERKSNINWTHIYSLLLIINIYKLYKHY
jgi:hypothetical protein